MAYNTTVTDLDLRYNQGIDSDVGKQASDSLCVCVCVRVCWLL